MNYKTVFLISVAGFLAAACSTPAVPSESQAQATDAALSSFSTCTSTARPTDISDCEDVYPSGGNTVSYNSYIYGKSTTQQDTSSGVKVLDQASQAPADESSAASASPEKATESAQSEQIFRQAYAAYLRTASPADLADMTAQWKKIAASANAQ